MNISIVGLGTWLPEEIRTNDAWPATFGKHDAAGTGERTFNDIPSSRDPDAARILERDLTTEASDPFLGAAKRHVAGEADSAREAESIAALRALADAGCAPEDVDVVISYSLVGDRISPTSSTAVAHRIGAIRAVGFGVDSTCASALIQLDLAHALIASGRARKVLLTQSHLLLRAMPMLHPATPGLGDAACAMLVSAGPGLTIRASHSATHGEFAESVLWRRSGAADEDPRWWKGGGDQRLGSFDMAGVKYLMRETVYFGAKTVREAAEKADVPVSSIAVLASVQPRGFVPGAIAEYLGRPRETAVTTYDDIAHVGACGPVFNLAKARAQGRLKPGLHVALYAQGAGFTRAATLLEVTTCEAHATAQ